MAQSLGLCYFFLFFSFHPICGGFVFFLRPVVGPPLAPKVVMDSPLMAASSERGAQNRNPIWVGAKEEEKQLAQSNF